MNWEVCLSTSVRWLNVVGHFVAMLLPIVRKNERLLYECMKYHLINDLLQQLANKLNKWGTWYSLYKKPLLWTAVTRSIEGRNCADNIWKLTCYTPIWCLYVALSLFSSVLFIFFLLFHHFTIILSQIIFSPFFLLTLSVSLPLLSCLPSQSLVSTPSIIYFLPTSHLSLHPPSSIIPSLYWCSCRNETWLWLICWQSLRGPLVVVPLHRGHVIDWT